MDFKDIQKIGSIKVIMKIQMFSFLDIKSLSLNVYLEDV